MSGFYTEKAFHSLKECDNRGTFHFERERERDVNERDEPLRVDQRVPYRLTLTNQQLSQAASYRAAYFSKKNIGERVESVYLLGYCLLVCSKLILEIV